VAAAVDAFEELVDIYVPRSKRLTDDAIRALTPLAANFRRFGAVFSQVADEGAKILATFPELREVRLEHSGVSDDGVAALGSCRRLEFASFDGSRAISGRGLAGFADHPKLRALFLRGTSVDDDGVGYLSGCTELRDLWLSSTRVTERCLLTLPDNPDLDVSLPRELDGDRVEEVRRQTNLTVDGVGPDHVVDIPRAPDGAPVDLPPELRGNALTFAVFTSDSCRPCQWLKTTFGQLRPNLREQFKYVELDVGDNLELASTMRVRSVPTVFVMQFGIELDRFTGAMGVEKLTERLEAVLAL
jgi:thiol-disulfide isomerase/thioredoxin